MTDSPDKKSKHASDPLEAYLKYVDVHGVPITDEPLWMDRVSEIANQLPEDVLAGITARLSTAIGQNSADIEGFASAHSLTKAEEKLLASLMQGRTVPQHAELNGISVNTGRVHMQRLLDKTAAAGQLDLMRLLYAFG